MTPKHIQEWAKRFVCGNEPEQVQQHIELLNDSGRSDSILSKGIQEVLDDKKPASKGFGHDAIGNDVLPLVNERGYFVRGDGSWKNVTASFESVVQHILVDNDFQSAVIDHVDNLYYSGGRPFLISNRPFLRVCKGWCGERAIWHAQWNPTEALTIPSVEKSYVDYFDTVGGVEGKIRQDFVLNEPDIQAIVQSFLNDEKAPPRFELALHFLGFHPELAEEYLSEFG